MAVGILLMLIAAFIVLRTVRGGLVDKILGT